MEPSCLAVFRDELTGMLPHDDDAQRLARNAYHFAEFFHTFDLDVPALARDALLWGHCHQRATGGVDPDRQVLERMGVTVTPVSGGCRGIAGAWGFEAGKYDISVECGEQALLPAVRAADPDTVVIADGFSCKTQIEQAGGGRRALHLAQVMTMARTHGRDGYRGGPPQQAADHTRPPATRHQKLVRLALPAAIVAACAAAGAAASPGRRRRTHWPLSSG